MCCTFAVGLGYRVIGVDTGDDKKKMVMDMGVEHFVDFMTTKDPFKEVQELTKGGAHAVLGCGGTAKSYVGATNYLRKTGECQSISATCSDI
jgi:propanol-preferring alcohol dehydrogenase